MGRFKPDPAPYLHASALAGVPITGMLMVAAHDWDCAGAMEAGAKAAFLERPGSIWSLPTPPPEIQTPDLDGLATALGA